MLRAQEAAKTLEQALKRFRGELTVADAAAKSGLALRDAETGLHELVARYQGHLAATSEGQLVFQFPNGLVKPKSNTPRWLRKLGRAAVGVGRFVVRAWVSIVVIAYAVAFGALMIAMAAKDDGRDGLGDAVEVVFRVVFEALFWTFHPFSPFYRPYEPSWLGQSRRQRRLPKVPFYERVNRFVFGPPPPPEPTAVEVQQGLADEIRRCEGRVGVGDVMRVTGMNRGEADAALSRLLLDYDGEIEVSEDGALIYVFKSLRQTALVEQSPGRQMQPFWRRKAEMLPVTGNPAGSNLLVGAVNGFNLACSGYAVANDLTVERLLWEFNQAMERSAYAPVEVAPPTGTPLLLGWVPFLFSGVLFALPALRSLGRRRQRRRLEAENGRRAVAARVFEQPRAVYGEDELAKLWQAGAGRAPTPQELLASVRSLGGEFDLHEDRPAFRFAELARERKALALARKQANETERSPGDLVFSSDR